MTRSARNIRKLLREIKEGALEYWINHNHLIATGRKKGEEWLDE